MKIKVVANGVTIKDDLCKSRAEPCGAYSLRAKANSPLCVQCGKWIHGRCAGEKEASEISRHCVCGKR